MRLWIDAELLRLGSLRAQAKREKGVPGPEGSVLKLLSGRVRPGVSELVVDLMGADGHAAARPVHAEPASTSGEVERRRPGARRSCGVARRHHRRRHHEIQKNIIGERVLGLPREPGFDPNTPWSQIPRN